MSVYSIRTLIHQVAYGPLLILCISIPLFADQPLHTNLIATQDLLTQLAQLNEICTANNQNTDTIDRKPIKDWTMIFFVAADNDLQSFAIRNIRQMASIGSNEHLNIIVHLDIRISNKKVTKRYYIERDNIIEVNGSDPSTQRMDSGDPQTVISCAKWAIGSFPAHHYMMVFWNHGTGYIDPAYSRIVKPMDLFTFNPVTYKLELDRDIEFFEYIHGNERDYNSDEDPTVHGVCWDDSTGHYLTNQKLQYALSIIQRDVLHGQKFDIIAFDACLMGMCEVDDLIKPFAHICVASQEVELGTGWNYQRVLAPFASQSLDPFTFAKHIVEVYEQTYGTITNDFTLSAVNLDQFDQLEQNVNTVAILLNQCLREQKDNSVKKGIVAARARKACTHFDEPSYLDLYHLYSNFQEQIQYFIFKNSQIGKTLTSDLYQVLETGKNIIKTIVIANKAGKNLAQAHGISIYFPERKMHSSYVKAPFARNEWATFLTNFLLLG